MGKMETTFYISNIINITSLLQIERENCVLAFNIISVVYTGVYMFKYDFYSNGDSKPH